MILAAVIVVSAMAVSGPEASGASGPADAIGFSLPDHRGTEHSLADYGESRLIVIVFLGTECPLAKLYGPRLAELHEKYAPRSVTVLGINSNVQDSPSEVADYARRHDIEFPILIDEGAAVADLLAAERTPEVFVLDQGRRVRYRGRIDDQCGVGYVRAEPTRRDLETALDELLAGKPVSTPRTEAVGCFIGRPQKAGGNGEVTYCKQIARLLQKHCVECHRPGEIAPFALTEYDEVAGWAETIVEVIEDGRMPPWHAAGGDFRNTRRMTSEEKELIRRWAAAGAPRGDPADLPPPRTFLSGWRLPRRPDLTFSMRSRPFQVPAEGIVEYQYFIVDPGLTEDKWVKAAEVVPGNRSVVHHAIVFVRAPGALDESTVGWLGAYVPGQSPMQLPEGVARRLPAGAKLIFQIHYTPTGSPQEDLTKIGLIFAEPESVREQVVTLAAINRKFEIPPRVADHRVQLNMREFPHGRLLSLAPHMHLRGRSFECKISGNGGGTATLLAVPRYDFNWQHIYQLKEPLAVSPDTRLQCAAVFDNSDGNPSNPDPGAAVRWGDQTWEEMALAFFDVAVPLDSRRQDKAGETADKVRREARRAAERLFARFDADGDGRLITDEVPPAFAAIGFRRLDKNRDGVVSLKEAAGE